MNTILFKTKLVLANASRLLTTMELDSMSRPLTKKDLALLNRDLHELELIRKDIQKAKEAGVPGCEEYDERTQKCIKRIEKFKRVYFSNEI